MNIKSLKLLTHDEIRSLYKEYLYSFEENKKSSIDVNISQTLYLWKNCGKDAFFDVALDDEFETNAPRKLKKYLLKTSTGDVENLVYTQMTSLRKFRNFIETYKIVKYSKKDNKFLKNTETKFKFKTPSPMMVALYIRELQDDIYTKEFDYLYRLGQRENSHQSQFSIYTKFLAINAFIETNFSCDFLYDLSEKMAKSSIFKFINDGRKEAMDKMLDLTKENKEIDKKLYYSFVSVYLSISKIETYPIYDNKIESVLIYLKNNKAFETPFTSKDLQNYENYTKVFDDFRKSFGLCGYSYKDINFYLLNLARKFF